MAHLTALEGIGKESAAAFLKRYDEIATAIERHPTSMLLRNRVLHAIVSQEEGEFKKRLLSRAALADEPVTTDTKRLIRMPTSLHGGSGMRVQPLETPRPPRLRSPHGCRRVRYEGRKGRPEVPAQDADARKYLMNSKKASLQYPKRWRYSSAAAAWRKLPEETRVKLDDLRSILLSERETGRLTAVAPDIFEKGHAELAAITKKVYAFEDPFSDEARSLIDETLAIRETLQDLFAIRSRKILALTVMHAEGNYYDREEVKRMIPAEKEMFEQITASIEQCQGILLHNVPHTLHALRHAVVAEDEGSEPDRSRKRNRRPCRWSSRKGPSPSPTPASSSGCSRTWTRSWALMGGFILSQREI